VTADAPTGLIRDADLTDTVAAPVFTRPTEHVHHGGCTLTDDGWMCPPDQPTTEIGPPVAAHLPNCWGFADCWGCEPACAQAFFARLGLA